MNHSKTSAKQNALLIAMLLLMTPSQGQFERSHSPLSSGSIYKIGVRESGIYKLTPSQIQTIIGTPIQNIAIYGNSGNMLPEINGEYCEQMLKLIPLQVHDANGNGIFDSDDHLLFYGEGAETWTYQSTSSQYIYQSHTYSKYNYYFVKIGGPVHKGVIRYEAIGSEARPFSTHTSVNVIDNDLINLYESGRIWLGEKFSSAATSRTFSLTFPGTMTGTIRTRCAFANEGSGGATFRVTSNGETRSNAIPAGTVYKTFENTFSATTTNNLSFEIQYVPATGSTAGYLDYISVNVNVQNAYSGNQNTFRFKQTDTDVEEAEYIVNNTAQNLRVWDITQIDSILELPLTQQSEKAHIIGPYGGSRKIILFNDASTLSPTSVNRIENQDIEGSETPDFVIVSKAHLMEQSERLANLHRIIDGMNVLVITDEAVFNEYSSGKQDPLAIRDMMRSFRMKDPEHKPKYLLLMGKGTFDNKNILGNNSSTLVTYETESSFDNNGASYCSDMILGYLDEGESGKGFEKVDLSIGRLPAKTESEAESLVNKIERYMMKQDLGKIRGGEDWRNTVTLLADDADPSSKSDTIFAYSAEVLATNIKEQYPNFNIDRIYADAYQEQTGAIGSFYPEVNNALKQRIDNGCIMLNYIGHGSTQYIGTERYMEMDDIKSYTNSDRLTLFITSTCSFGKYDMPNDICGAESFLLSSGAGIGVISASRPIVHVETFNTSLCLQALNPENRIGDALKEAKNHYSASQCIALLGDPALRLTIPTHQVKVTSINGHLVNPERPDSVQVLTEVVVEGEIVDGQGNVDENFSGTIIPTVYDRETLAHTLANDNEGTEIAFWQQKSVLYKGRDSVENGHFSYRFIVPRDVAYEYGKGKLSHYAFSGTTDATGAYTNIYFGGLDTSTIGHDAFRPNIKLYLNDSTFRTGGSTDESPYIYALLEDSLGINSVGSGLGHDITATLDGNGNNIIVLNDFYEPDYTDSRRGTIRYQLNDLAEGWHTLTLKAWNIYNYSNSSSIKFHVKRSTTPDVTDFFARPNPASEKTEIRIEHNAPKEVRHADIVIYDSHGDIVRHIHVDKNEESYVLGPAIWDFTNDGGSPVMRGIYVAHLTITTTSGDIIHKATKIVKI